MPRRPTSHRLVRRLFTMVGRVALSSLLLTCPLISTATDLTAKDAGFDYLYIESNEGGSSGGHTAMRFGRDVYHFQNENGLLVLQRDRANEFLYAYALLGNRNIHSTRIAVSRETRSTLVDQFKQRHRAQEAQLRLARELNNDRNLVELLRDDKGNSAVRRKHRSLAVPGLGYFDLLGKAEMGSGPDAALPTHSSDLQSLREAIDQAHGPDFRSNRRRALIDGMHSLLEGDPTNWTVDPPNSAYDHPRFTRSFSHRVLDVAAGLAALDVLEQASPLATTARRVPTDAYFALTPEESQALGRYARELAGQLVQLVDSRRSDWGQALLIGMARLAALTQSVESRHLVFLDTYPDSATLLDEGGLDRLGELGSTMLAEHQRRLDASRTYFRENAAAGELAWERIEERSNRYLEMLRALHDEAPMRVARGHLVPSREAPYPIAVSPMRSADERHEDLERARQRERDYSRALRRLHRYGLLDQNCATALFETINDSFGGSVEISRQQLGGHVPKRGSLAFIPFISDRQVNDRYSVLARETIPSYRELRIRAMKARESSLRVALRESNTFTSTTYERSSADSFFIFFTDDAPYLRPILGVVNLTAALGQSVLGLFAAPIDRGEILLRGLRGTFVSLPELAFANIRKGSNDWIPKEHRSLEPVRDP